MINGSVMTLKIKSLPYRHPLKAEVYQGWGGEFSHFKYLYGSVDFSLPVGHEVVAVEDGTVVELRDTIPDAPDGVSKINKSSHSASLGSSNIGNFITLKHDVGESVFYTTYCHFQRGSIPFAKGAFVKAGQTIGKIGRTGYIDGIHLHFHAGTSSVQFRAGLVADASLGKAVGFANLPGDASYPQVGSSYQGGRFEFAAADYVEQAGYLALEAGGEANEWWIRFRNTGNIPWENHNANDQIAKLALGTRLQPDMIAGREFIHGWPGETRLAIVEQPLVSPGEEGVFRFKVQAPANKPPGEYRLQLTPKTPNGWLQQADGLDLNCFLIVDRHLIDRVDDLDPLEHLAEDRVPRGLVEEGVVDDVDEKL